MDPDVCYGKMRTALQDDDLDTAREHALALRNWLDRGGFWPLNYSPAEVLAYLESVLTFTAKLSESAE